MRLKEQYSKKVLPELKAKFGYKNNLAAPRVEKVVLNVDNNISIINNTLLLFNTLYVKRPSANIDNSISIVYNNFRANLIHRHYIISI